MTQSKNIDYASLRLTDTVPVMNTRYYCFKDQYGQTAVVTAGSQFDQLLRTIRLAQQHQEQSYEAQ